MGKGQDHCSAHTGRQWFKGTSTSKTNLPTLAYITDVHAIYHNIMHKYSNITHSISVHVNFGPPLRNSWAEWQCFIVETHKRTFVQCGWYDVHKYSAYFISGTGTS